MIEEQLSLAELVSAVQGLRAHEVMRSETVVRLEQGARIRPEELERYCFTRPEGYARNLIFRSEALELLVLCWDAGAATAIHDHAGQQCVLSVQQGVLQQRNYRWAGDRIRLSGARLLGPGDVDARGGDEELHEIVPLTPAVSVHLYARPIAACHTYGLESGRVEVKTLRYDSMYGRATRLGLVAPGERSPLREQAPSATAH